VSVEDQLLDTHARDAQLDKSKIQTTRVNAILQFVTEPTKSLDQLMPHHAVSAKIANGQNTFQTTRELNASLDQLLSAIASARTQLTEDTLVNSAHMDKDKTQPTNSNVSLHQLATKETKFLVLVMPKTATDAEPAQLHSFQDKTDLNATDQDQLVDVLRDTLKMDIAAKHAQLDKSPLLPTKLDKDSVMTGYQELNATQLKSAMAQEKSSELPKTAMLANNAHQTLSHLKTEEDVRDQSQPAHVLKDTLLMDMNAKNAQLDKSLIQTTTRDVSQESATKETKSLEEKTSAGIARPAHKATNQTHPELSASESSQLAAALRSMIKVVMFAYHAHHIKLPPTVTEDVSQDNAQDSTRSLVLPTNAMLANNAKRDQPQTTSEEDV